MSLSPSSVQCEGTWLCWFSFLSSYLEGRETALTTWSLKSRWRWRSGGNSRVSKHEGIQQTKGFGAWDGLCFKLWGSSGSSGKEYGWTVGIKMSQALTGSIVSTAVSSFPESAQRNVDTRHPEHAILRPKQRTRSRGDWSSNPQDRSY